MLEFLSSMRTVLNWMKPCLLQTEHSDSMDMNHIESVDRSIQSRSTDYKAGLTWLIKKNRDRLKKSI